MSISGQQVDRMLYLQWIADFSSPVIKAIFELNRAIVFPLSRGQRFWILMSSSNSSLQRQRLHLLRFVFDGGNQMGKFTRAHCCWDIFIFETLRKINGFSNVQAVARIFQFSSAVANISIQIRRFKGVQIRQMLGEPWTVPKESGNSLPTRRES